MKIERTRSPFLATFYLPSPSSDLKVPIVVVVVAAAVVLVVFTVFNAVPV